MKGQIRIIFIAVALLLLGGACNKKLVTGVKTGKDFNMSGYDALYVEAIKQKLLGNIGDAMEYFEKCTEMNPASDASYYQMAQIVISRGDLANGKNYLKKACELQPGNIWYNMLLAGIYNRQNNIDSTIICYERAVKANPEKDDLLVSLAALYTKNKNYEKAKNILNRFDERYGVNEKTTISLVETLMAEGKNREALQKVQQLLSQSPDDIMLNGYLAEIYRSEGKTEQAGEVYSGLIERNPDNPGIQLSLISFLLSEKDYDQLFELLNTVVMNDKVSREEKISLFSGLIENQDIIKGYSSKMELLLMILEANFNNDSIIMLLRPEFLQNQKKLAEAAELLEKVIRNNPDNYFAWEKLLLVYLEKKDYKKLEERGRECSTMFNRSVIAKLLYANAALENQHYDTAIEELRKADILAGDNKDIKIQVLTIRADVYYRMKNFTEAFKAYDEALKINDNDLTVMNNYAYYLAEQNMNLKEAERMSKIVIEKDKENSTFLDTYAWVLYKRGKTREAAKIMEKIMGSDNGEDAEYFEHYGYIMKKLGKYAGAIASWEKALLLDNSKQELKKEIENCKRLE